MKSFFALALAVLALSGCATTTTLKSDQCTQADWQKVGIADGMRGASSQQILAHTKTCQGKAIPNQQLWEQGRQEGLKSYCTTTNAYNIGRMGYTLNAVCDGEIENLAELHHANMMGLQQYEMSERINQLNRGWGLYDGFFPYHPYRRWW